jgi:hypothetical protein
VILKTLIELLAREPRQEGHDNPERELPQRWRDPPPRPEKPAPFPFRHA